MFGSILIFLLVLSILVLVHELGHFFIARKNGVWVEEFGFGIPPRIWGKKIGNTIYSLNLLPFGGFVRLHGENTEDDITKPEKSFLGKSKKARSSIVIAGVIMNFILGILAFSVVYLFSGIPKETKDVKVLDVTAGSPAQTGGMLVGDIIKKVDGEDVFATKEFIDKIESKKGMKVQIEIERKVNDLSSALKIIVVPRQDHPKDEGPLGVVISTTEIYFPPIWQRPFLGIYYGFKEAIYWGQTVLLGFWKIVSELFRGVIPKDVSGPVGIFVITSEAAKIGILALINFIGILSVNLAILNILPIPAMDGGRLLFIGIEAFFGKKVLPKVETYIHMIGMALLILLLLVITAADIKRLIVNGGISGFLDSFLK